MAISLFITEQHIKELSIIDENIDAKLIQNAIREAEDMHIHPILGTALFNELKTQINAGSVSSANDTLLADYIKWSLIYWTMYEGVDIFTYKIRNKGIYKQTSENSTPIDLEETKRLMDNFLNKAEWYSQRLTNYLLENQATFPLYNNAGSGIDTIYPTTNNYTSGWFLGKSLPTNPADYNRSNQLDV